VQGAFTAVVNDSGLLFAVFYILTGPGRHDTYAARIQPAGRPGAGSRASCSATPPTKAIRP
jgi:hypothetical protein